MTCDKLLGESKLSLVGAMDEFSVQKNEIHSEHELSCIILGMLNI